MVEIGPCVLYVYSVLKAITGSFLAASRDGNRPAISVKVMLNATNAMAVGMDKLALTLVVPTNLWITALIGLSSNNDIPTPNRPDSAPMIKVSALKTCEMLKVKAS